MERKFYTDDFERLLKEKTDEFRMYPSKRVWHSIYNDLHPGRKWPSIAVSLLLISALLITGYWNSYNEKHVTADTSVSNSKNTNITKTTAAEVNNYTYQPTPLNNSNKTVADYNTTGATTAASLPLTNNVVAKNINANKGKYNVILSAKTNSFTTNNRTKAIPDVNSISGNTDNDISVTVAPSTVLKGNTNSSSNISNNTLADAKIDGSVKNNTSEEIQEKNSTTEKSINAAATATTDNLNTNVIADNLTKINPTAPAATSVSAEKTTVAAQKNTAVQKSTSTEDKAWVDNYAFYNKSTRKRWKDRTAKEFYITPGIGFRTFSNNSPYDVTNTATALNTPYSNNSLNAVLDQKAGLGIEAGLGIVYTLSKKLRVKTGVQANYTSYTIFGTETNHPILTTLRLTDINTGYPYMASRTATLSNNSTSKTDKAHNKTYQVSIPIGLAYKIVGNDKLEWYAGASIQPTFVIGGKANLISDDRKNYVADNTLLRRWNLNSGFETYINYKFDGMTLQVGPQFRYQLLSTYSSQYTINENLYNVGVKIGILKNF
jgi:hypothetical protein